ncbi:growth arrest-specific protein 6 [Latimeria chalumnae]|uniref:Growth arrest specific 6 n=1 Tax=Latimeria chalumnae TaxID=7897 RepID=M3XIG7_LATCH|nr:PREDICTED: growth arrest-specific protein 6 [Latimeria chalumnae]|eukprot:XP_005998137.2 PREDICTED: growth arrest-specific protein 6 [Latimeria chalumnae]
MPTLSAFKTTFLLLLVAKASSNLLLPGKDAAQFLSRQRRGYQVFEETRQGHLERECVEEKCNKEEAREVFENNPETEYFYPKYLECILKYGSPYFKNPDFTTCVHNLPNQCIPMPCNVAGTKSCEDKQGEFICHCKSGWRGAKCEEDINECEERNGDCRQICVNTQGTYHCLCRNGYSLHPDKKSCQDINECSLEQGICGEARCVNLESSYECVCDEGYKYDVLSKSCQDVDECAAKVCSQTCINSPGSYNCLCNGQNGEKLGADMSTCEMILPCVPLHTVKSIEYLYLGRMFSGVPVIRLRFRRIQHTRFTAEFDFRTFDPEGVIFFAGSQPEGSWIIIALRDGKLELQFKYKGIGRVTTSGSVISNGEWHTISVEELSRNLVIKINKEAVMKIAVGGDLFTLKKNLYELHLTVGGIPLQNGELIKPINPRLDGCMRGWSWLDGEDTSVQQAIKMNEKMQCFSVVRSGSYYPGTGFALYSLNYTHSSDQHDSKGEWAVNINAQIRPATDTGVLFALVSDTKVPLLLALVDYHSVERVKEQHIILAIEDVIVSSIALPVCDAQEHLVKVLVTKDEIFLKVDETVGQSELNMQLKKSLSTLDSYLKGDVSTYLGGLPEIHVASTPVTAFYNGCMTVQVNNKALDLDEAAQKHNDIRSHSCPQVEIDHLNKIF